MIRTNPLFLALALLVGVTAAVFAGGSTEEPETAPMESTEMAEAEPLAIGITKIVAHPALDALENGLMEVVSAAYPDTVYDNQNANGDVNTAASIAQKFRADGVDIAVGIATPTAQALANVITDAPVVFCAVTDPVDAGLVPSLQRSEGNITGISDMTPVRDQIELLAGMIDLQTLGHVYTSSEANAVRLAEMAKEACDDLGIAFVETTVSNSGEVKQAAQAIAGRVDAFYVSTDNTVVSALSALTDAAAKAGVPVLSADPSSAEETGVFLAWGFDYYKMGLATGRLIIEIVEGASPASIPTRFMTSVEDIDLFVNLDVAEDLGITVPRDVVDAAATLVRNGEIEKR